MRIRGKILGGLAAVTVLTMAMGGYAALSLQQAGSLTERLYDGPLMASDFAGQAMTTFVRLDRAVTRANEAVSRAESIRKIKVLDSDFTEANGYLTPSLKVKRALVLRDFAPQIEELYVDTRAEGSTAAH